MSCLQHIDHPETEYYSSFICDGTATPRWECGYCGRSTAEVAEIDEKMIEVKVQCVVEDYYNLELSGSPISNCTQGEIIMSKIVAECKAKGLYSEEFILTEFKKKLQQLKTKEEAEAVCSEGEVTLKQV